MPLSYFCPNLQLRVSPPRRALDEVPTWFATALLMAESALRRRQIGHAAVARMSAVFSIGPNRGR